MSLTEDNRKRLKGKPLIQRIKLEREWKKEREQWEQFVQRQREHPDEGWKRSMEQNFDLDFRSSQQTYCKKQCEMQCANEPEPQKIRNAINSAHYECQKSYNQPDLIPDTEALAYCDNLKQKYEAQYKRDLDPDFAKNLTQIQQLKQNPYTES